MTLKEAQKFAEVISSSRDLSGEDKGKLCSYLNQTFPGFTFAYHEKRGVALVSDNGPTLAQLHETDMGHT